MCRSYHLCVLGWLDREAIYNSRFSANWSTSLKAHFILKSEEGCSRTSTNLQTLTITCFLTEQKLTKNSYPESGLKHQMSNNTLSLEKTMSWVACCLNIHCTMSLIMMVYGAAVHKHSHIWLFGVVGSLTSMQQLPTCFWRKLCCSLGVSSVNTVACVFLSSNSCTL